MLKFNRVGIIVRHSEEKNAVVFRQLVNYLLGRKKLILFDQYNPFLNLARDLFKQTAGVDIDLDLYNMATADLVVVIGGDGTILRASPWLSQINIPVIGINTGHTGFLADIEPETLISSLDRIFAGEYNIDQRFLLEAYQKKAPNERFYALNEVVIHADQMVYLIELALYCDQQLAFRQRCDGLIIATPTGTTAYALSAGGPVIHPLVDALAIVPLYPQALTFRPMVVSSATELAIKGTSYNKSPLSFSCDGYIQGNLQKDDQLIVNRSANCVTFLHPLTHNFYENYRQKIN